MNSTLHADIREALDSADDPLVAVATAVYDVFDVQRVSIARIDEASACFEIAANAGANLLAPGTALPVATCSYFARAAEGRPFHDDDFDASRAFELPLDNVVLAAGFHAGCSVPIRREGTSVGAISLSAATRRNMSGFIERLDGVADMLGSEMVDPGPERAANVLICHGDELVGRGLARLAEFDEGVRASVAPTLAAAVAALAGTPVDVVVCDDWMDGLRVDAVASALREAGMQAPMLVVSSRDTPESVRASLLAGASAYIARRDAVTDLRGALATVRAGHTMLPDPPSEPGTRLTMREHELLEALDEGLRFKQVAVRLGISEATAKTHGRNLFRKLGATSRAEAVHAARERGLLG